MTVPGTFPNNREPESDYYFNSLKQAIDDLLPNANGPPSWHAALQDCTQVLQQDGHKCPLEEMYKGPYAVV